MAVAANLTLWSLVERVARDALTRIRTLDEADFKFARDSDYPVIEDTQSAYATVTSSSTGPLKYADAFGHETRWGTAVTYNELDGYSELVAYVKADAHLTEFLCPVRLKDAFGERFFWGAVAALPLEIAERHTQLVGWSANSDLLLELYVPLETWWLQHDALPVELFVPILAISFEDDLLELVGGARVERISAALQRARRPSSFVRPNLALLRPATHALVIPALTIVNQEFQEWLRPAPEIPHADVDRFFEALAIAASWESGYAQSIYVPVGWANRYRGDLPSVVFAADSRRYPPRLESGLASPSETLDRQQGKDLQLTYGALLEARRETRLASRRLFGAGRRDDEGDQIVDLCIGIEALVSDSHPGDTTYKIAMRTAAALGDEMSASAVYSAMKGVYSYRSAVVHGRSDVKKRRRVPFGNQQFPAYQVAHFFLRRLLFRFLMNPTLDASGLDEHALDRLSGRQIAVPIVLTLDLTSR